MILLSEVVLLFGSCFVHGSSVCLLYIDLRFPGMVQWLQFGYLFNSKDIISLIK